MFELASVVLLSALIALPAIAAADNKPDPALEILALEKAAMERWGKGDPQGYLDISAEDVTYFDPFTAKRLNGLPELARLYNGLAGQVHVDRFDFVDPKIEVSGDLAVLSYNFVSYTGNEINRWNISEVYRKTNGKWKIIHSHFSPTQPKLAEKPKD